MELIDRTKCVLCADADLKPSYVLKDHTYTYSPTHDRNTGDAVYDIPVGACTQCASLQLMKLVPPEVLYAESHNGTFDTPTWKRHHAEFAEFCKRNLGDSSSCVEIGGGNGALAESILASSNSLAYTVLDLAGLQTHPSIVFEHGNCETYTYTQDTILMSHVFEHLYNPRRFLENVAACNVKRIIVSVPNLEELLRANNINLVHLEHTFYFDALDLHALFGQFGYACKAYQPFGSHSMFFAFERGTQHDLRVVRLAEHAQLLSSYGAAREDALEKIRRAIPDDDKPIVIIPAGHYGYTLYNALASNKVLCFLDNDKTKQGKYVFGTNCMTHSMDAIETLPPSIVLVYAGPYTEEIIAQLHSKRANHTYISAGSPRTGSTYIRFV